jgi:hypothetical protein
MKRNALAGMMGRGGMKKAAHAAAAAKGSAMPMASPGKKSPPMKTAAKKMKEAMKS